MAIDDPFSPDYSTARRRFLRAAESRGLSIESHPTGLSGPDGEPLTIDVARLGSAQARRVVVASSGLHGVEGFFGSAVQLAWLDDPGRLPDDVAVVLIHALNPFGFAYVRRFDEDNVDLNRNFLLNGEAYRGSPSRYAELDGLLNPRSPARGVDTFLSRSLAAIGRYGFSHLKQAVAGGQYDFPLGIFFGGRGPSPLRAFLAEALPRWVGPAEQVIHLDFHTGLGSWGEYKLLTEACVDADRLKDLASWFGEDRLRGPDPDGIAYEVRGGFGTWCERLLADRDYTLLCAEFGTYPALRVVQALRAENREHHWDKPDSEAARRAKARLKEVFVPSDAIWRHKTVAEGLGLIRRSLNIDRKTCPSVSI